MYPTEAAGFLNEQGKPYHPPIDPAHDRGRAAEGGRDAESAAVGRVGRNRAACGFVMVNARPLGMDAAMRDWFDLFGWLFVSGALLYITFLVVLPVVD